MTRTPRAGGAALDWPNGDRIASLLQEIDASGMAGVGGGDVCHYDCQ